MIGGGSPVSSPNANEHTQETTVRHLRVVSLLTTLVRITSRTVTLDPVPVEVDIEVEASGVVLTASLTDLHAIINHLPETKQLSLKYLDNDKPSSL